MRGMTGRGARNFVGYGLPFVLTWAGGLECTWNNIPFGIALSTAGWVLMYAIAPERAVPVSEPRCPRDMSRPYPRPQPRGTAAEVELLFTCPVCGMDDPAGLDGDLMGWPAHSACREWLGGFTTAGPWTPSGPGLTSWTCADCGQRFSGTPDDIAVSFAAHRTAYGDCYQRQAWRQQSRAGVVWDQWCSCGRKLTGTTAQNTWAITRHHASGECPHAVKGSRRDRRALRSPLR